MSESGCDPGSPCRTAAPASYYSSSASSELVNKSVALSQPPTSMWKIIQAQQQQLNQVQKQLDHISQLLRVRPSTPVRVEDTGISPTFSSSYRQQRNPTFVRSGASSPSSAWSSRGGSGTGVPLPSRIHAIVPSKELDDEGSDGEELVSREVELLLRKYTVGSRE